MKTHDKPRYADYREVLKRAMNHEYIFAVLVLALVVVPASATQDETRSINLFVGASYNYIENHEYYAIVVHDEYQRRVEFWVIKNGELIDRETCYKGDVCYLKNAKIRLTTVFCGREATAVWFDLLDKKFINGEVFG